MKLFLSTIYLTAALVSSTNVPEATNGASLTSLSVTAAVDIRGIVQPVALQGGTEWDDPDTYQAQAMAWLEGDAFSFSLSPERIVQRYAVACIYYATYSVATELTVAEPNGWTESAGWLEGVSECSWFGLNCNGNDKVEKIQLSSNGITGSFPAETALLASSLKEIDLFRNLVHNAGDAGHEWLGELTKLEALYIGQTNFEYDDGIPPQISKLTNLKELDCSATLYTGPLVGFMFSPLVNLEYVVLSHNAYSSTIPVEIGNLPKLEFFYAQEAFLYGSLSFMENMPSIVELWVDQNPGLGGAIPTFIGSLKSLRSWSITSCGFTGSVPTELGLLTDLVRVWLHDNALTGSVPTELGNMVDLQTLTLGKNALVGTMPEEICLNAPLGSLTILEADCSPTALEVECSCCTCCQNCSLPYLLDSATAAPIDQLANIIDECTNFDMNAQKVGDQFTIDFVGKQPAVMESLTVASNREPFFFNLTEEVLGVIVAAGERFESSMYSSFPSTDVARSVGQRNFLITLTAKVNGTECRQTGLSTSSS